METRVFATSAMHSARAVIKFVLLRKILMFVCVPLRVVSFVPTHPVASVSEFAFTSRTILMHSSNCSVISS